MTQSANYFKRNGDWTINDQVACHVFRDAWTIGDMGKSRRTYYLDIAPGMDISVAVAACLYIHERVNEGQDKKSTSSTVNMMTIAGAAGGASA